MSGTANNFSAPRGLGYAHIASRWRWFVALGTALFVLGVLALGDVVAITLISVIFIGAALLVGGVARTLHAFITKSWSAFALNLIGGLLYIVGGLLIMDEPVAGSVVITILLLVSIAVGGVLQIVIGMRHRDLTGWWVLALGGVVSVIVGVLLYASLPWSGLWVLGTLIGIELLVQGATWFRVGLTLRRLAR
jgi:uncharacterized membrane protein HdeD (DUF308 family)